MYWEMTVELQPLGMDMILMSEENTVNYGKQGHNFGKHADYYQMDRQITMERIEEQLKIKTRLVEDSESLREENFQKITSPVLMLVEKARMMRLRKERLLNLVLRSPLVTLGHTVQRQKKQPIFRELKSVDASTFQSELLLERWFCRDVTQMMPDVLFILLVAAQY